MRIPPAFIRTISDAPDDDGPRLVLADWLEEHGDCDRAEFIRNGIELANGGHLPSFMETNLRLRQSQLIMEHGAEWFALPGLKCRPYVDGSSVLFAEGWNINLMQVTTSRGFVDCIHIRMNDWFADGNVESVSDGVSICPLCHTRQGPYHAKRCNCNCILEAWHGYGPIIAHHWPRCRVEFTDKLADEWDQRKAWAFYDSDLPEQPNHQFRIAKEITAHFKEVLDFCNHTEQGKWYFFNNLQQATESLSNAAWDWAETLARKLSLDSVTAHV